jgi:hypothetical protein
MRVPLGEGRAAHAGVEYARLSASSVVRRCERKVQAWFESSGSFPPPPVFKSGRSCVNFDRTDRRLTTAGVNRVLTRLGTVCIILSQLFLYAFEANGLAHAFHSSSLTNTFHVLVDRIVQRLPVCSQPSKNRASASTGGGQ